MNPLPPPPDWHQDVACAGTPGPWDTTDTGRVNPDSGHYAIRVCNTCPVREHCLNSALEREMAYSSDLIQGIYGGLTPAQRGAILDRKRGNRRSRGTCTYCGKRPLLARVTAVTCGARECQDAHCNSFVRHRKYRRKGAA